MAQTAPEFKRNEKKNREKIKKDASGYVTGKIGDFSCLKFFVNAYKSEKARDAQKIAETSPK